MEAPCTFPVGTFALESGATLSGVQVGYRTWGTLNAAGDNAVVVCHSLTGDSDAPSWWPGLVGPGAALDTNRWFVICANVLGSCYGTTGPTSVNPETGLPYGPDFPIPTIRDTVRLHRRLTDGLGVRSIAAVVGGSMGGFQVLEWAFETTADGSPLVKRLVPVATSGRHSAWCIAWTESQRQAIYADPNWHGGRYTPDRTPVNGLAAARMMAMLSYRNASSFQTRFGRDIASAGDGAPAADGLFSVQSYLHYQGRKLVDRFDANCYVRLSQSANTHDVSRGRGGYAEVLGRIAQPALVIGVDSDVLFPLAEQEELTALMPRAELAVMRSEHGHDGFLIDTDTLGSLVAAWLR